jgi:uncharacterized protein
MRAILRAAAATLYPTALDESTDAYDTIGWLAKHASGFRDDYTAFLEAGSTGCLGRTMRLEQLGFWHQITERPAYDRFRQGHAFDKRLARQPLTAAMLLVHSLWDREDIRGAIAVFTALSREAGGGLAHLVIGPWRHRGATAGGSALRPIQFGSDTALYSFKRIQQPFLNQYLKNGGPAGYLPPERWVA